ncbi:MAG: glycosyltransferase family 4 protein [Cyanobacteria bacterium]|nr:glycosyltransferase family 4 protein [Cyanobacteria bacterium CG_2015-16_32_12]NCO76710.1 glycosyltransferase family 4 protein [Cyanobacteria bacterium CG_2015-22_32_23]NCQ03865.1 glycosyltransferase family 4 protein [Cyanobacteria bacterium CG_2015-09_32_10]NCQ40900.1 glycosyltransferase family 4 protein [Cyanobacteria bacterium CG_2015-04_32_10]NCS85262.1 glycosyltransferase family 4 protein [Cyanobacteria bacterium CG_2015-02_32_10]
MVKVLLDCSSIRDYPSGVGFYTYNLIKGLKEQENQTSFAFEIYRQPSFKHWLTNNHNLPDILQDISPLKFLFLPITISNLLGKSAGLFINRNDAFWQNLDIIHGTDHYVFPFPYGKKVMTIHDLTFLKFPFYSNKIVKTYTKRIKKCLQWTDLIITFSENTKQDIMDYFGVKSDQIAITSEASRYNINYLKDKNIEEIKSKIDYDFQQPFILFVSTIEPRKNIINLVKAFNLIKEKYAVNHHLILIGQKGWEYEKIFAEIENSNFREKIHYLGYLSDETVAVFYSLADAFVYPSLYEGFGLPILEAMTLGTPVITSNTSCLPEVAQNAAMYINPDDYESIATTIYEVISQPDLQKDLIIRGKNRAKLYSWERVAQETLKAYELILP